MSKPNNEIGDAGMFGAEMVRDEPPVTQPCPITAQRVLAIAGMLGSMGMNKMAVELSDLAAWLEKEGSR